MTEQKQFRPMLASPVEDPAALRYPVLVSPKLDGIRCVIRDGIPYTRKLKPIPNRFVRQALTGLPDFDGEILVGAHDRGVFDRTQSAVMTHEGEPYFTYWVFDNPNHSGGFERRYMSLVGCRTQFQADMLRLVPHYDVCDLQTLLANEQIFVAQGYEGMMIRAMDGPYKHGRSTAKEGWLLKMKRWQDAEAVILGYEPLLRNHNEKEVSELGLTKRAKKKEFMIPDPTRFGKMICGWLDQAKYGTATFEIGSGFTDAQRQDQARAGSFVRFKFQDVTKDGKPRFPIFLNYRHPEDTDVSV